MSTQPSLPSSEPLRVLLVEDDRYDVQAFRRALRQLEPPYDILNVSRAEEALVHLEEQRFDLVVVDNRLPGMSGLELCQRLVGSDPEFALVLLTGSGSEEIAVEALKAGVHEYIVKEAGPSYLELLATVLPKAVQRVRESSARRRAEREVQKSARRLRQVIDLVPHLIFARDLQGRFLLANRAAAEACGTTVEELTEVPELGGQPPIDNEQLQRLTGHDAEVIATQRPKFIPEEDFVDHDGQRHILQTSKIPFTESGSTAPAVLTVSIDITAHKRAEQELFEEKERAQVTLHSIGDAVITTSPEGRVEYLNPAAEAMTGWSLEEARGRLLREVFRVLDERTRKPVPDPVLRCLEQRGTVELAQYSVLVSRTGQEYAIQDSASPIRGRQGKVLGVVLVFNDVTEARRNARRMAHLATHDPLTGLVNRREFERRLERALRASCQAGVQHALCFLDLDHFKGVNDSVGHTAGDQLLKRISALLSSRIRSRDTLGRLGGDEFGLLLENCPLEKAVEIAQELVGSVRQLRFGWQGRVFQVGVSIGVIPISPAAVSTGDLLRWGDDACYVAKDLGRNRVHVGRGDGSGTGAERAYSADLATRLGLEGRLEPPACGTAPSACWASRSCLWATACRRSRRTTSCCCACRTPAASCCCPRPSCPRRSATV